MAKPVEFKLTPALTMALAKCVKDKEASAARDLLNVGAFEISNLVELRGMLTVGPDVPPGEPREDSGAFDPWVLLYLALEDKPAAAASLARRAAKFKPGVGPNASDELRMRFTVLAAELLPKIVIAGSAGRRGSISFAGAVRAVS